MDDQAGRRTPVISVIVATLNDERRLAGTLAPLIEAAVDGLVRQVIVADGGSTDATLEIAEDAGATVVAGDLAAGLAAVRHPWVMMLEVGARLEPGWERAAHLHMQAVPARAGRIAPAATGWLGRVMPGAPVGLLAPVAMAAGGRGSVRERARALGAVRLGFAAAVVG